MTRACQCGLQMLVVAGVAVCQHCDRLAHDHAGPFGCARCRVLKTATGVGPGAEVS